MKLRSHLSRFSYDIDQELGRAGNERELFHGNTESQIHRTVRVGRDLWKSFIPTPLTMQFHRNSTD